MLIGPAMSESTWLHPTGLSGSLFHTFFLPTPRVDSTASSGPVIQRQSHETIRTVTQRGGNHPACSLSILVRACPCPCCPHRAVGPRPTCPTCGPPCCRPLSHLHSTLCPSHCPINSLRPLLSALTLFKILQGDHSG